MTGDWLAQAAALIAEADGRAAQKRLGAWLDAQPSELRQAVLQLAASRGVDLPADAEQWPGKRLLRRAQARQDASRVRRNPVRVDEPFTCARCGAAVTPGGRRVRDHCPHCLTGRHVDVVPGDRASSCGGLLRPVGLEVVGADAVLRFACQHCGHTIRVRAHPDDEPAALAAVSALARP